MTGLLAPVLTSGTLNEEITSVVSGSWQDISVAVSEGRNTITAVLEATVSPTEESAESEPIDLTAAVSSLGTVSFSACPSTLQLRDVVDKNATGTAYLKWTVSPDLENVGAFIAADPGVPLGFVDPYEDQPTGSCTGAVAVTPTQTTTYTLYVFRERPGLTVAGLTAAFDDDPVAFQAFFLQELDNLEIALQSQGVSVASYFKSRTASVTVVPECSGVSDCDYPVSNCAGGLCLPLPPPPLVPGGSEFVFLPGGDYNINRLNSCNTNDEAAAGATLGTCFPIGTMGSYSYQFQADELEVFKSTDCTGDSVVANRLPFRDATQIRISGGGRYVCLQENKVNSIGVYGDFQLTIIDAERAGQSSAVPVQTFAKTLWGDCGTGSFNASGQGMQCGFLACSGEIAAVVTKECNSTTVELFNSRSGTLVDIETDV